MFSEVQIARFYSHVDKKGPDECWNWMGKHTRDGYGSVHMRTQTFAAHRVAYMIARGSIAPGQWVLHSCDNRSCCNPAHLFLGTNIDNVRDRVKKNRSARSFPPGHTYKLTRTVIDQLREDAKTITNKHELARRYGITPVTVREILAGKYWKEEMGL